MACLYTEACELPMLLKTEGTVRKHDTGMQQASGKKRRKLIFPQLFVLFGRTRRILERPY